MRLFLIVNRKEITSGIDVCVKNIFIIISTVQVQAQVTKIAEGIKCYSDCVTEKLIQQNNIQ